MKPSVQSPRTPSDLSDSLQRHLNAYALAASAAGVGMLALATRAEAKIIYIPAHKHIFRGTDFHLDLNRDGVADFRLNNVGSGSHDSLSAVPDRMNAVWGYGNPAGTNQASALPAGERVGPGGRFVVGAAHMAFTEEFRPATSSGQWCNVSKRYLGLRFAVSGKTHFGWARLNVACSGDQVKATLTGYAYETVPARQSSPARPRGRMSSRWNPAASERWQREESSPSGRTRPPTATAQRAKNRHIAH